VAKKWHADSAQSGCLCLSECGFLAGLTNELTELKAVQNINDQINRAKFYMSLEKYKSSFIFRMNFTTSVKI
jgi:hypothetical protein